MKFPSISLVAWTIIAGVSALAEPRVSGGEQDRAQSSSRTELNTPAKNTDAGQQQHAPRFLILDIKNARGHPVFPNGEDAGFMLKKSLPAYPAAPIVVLNYQDGLSSPFYRWILMDNGFEEARVVTTPYINPPVAQRTFIRAPLPLHEALKAAQLYISERRNDPHDYWLSDVYVHLHEKADIYRWIFHYSAHGVDGGLAVHVHYFDKTVTSQWMP